MSKSYKKKTRDEIRSAALQSEINENIGNKDHDASFFSYQSHNMSFTANHTPLDSNNSDLENLPSLNQNFSSIFNVPTPNKNAFFNTVYQTLSNSIKESIDMPVIVPKDLSRFDINPNSFQNYLSNIKSTYDSYKKMNKLKHIAEKSKENQINCQQCTGKKLKFEFKRGFVGKALAECYKNIPNNFFNEDFAFDSRKFSRQVKKICEFQDELYDYLDEVELNLSYQIKVHFHEYMDVMINLNTIEAEINQALKNLAYLKKYQNNLKNIYLYSRKIIALKIKSLNIEKVYEILKIMRSGLRIYQNIKGENANDVEKEDLLAYFAKLKGNAELTKIVSIRTFKPAFKEFKRKYINEIVSSFNLKSLNCLEKSFLYVKSTPGEHESQLEESILGMTSMNDSYFQDYSLSERPDEITKFLWTIPDFGSSHPDVKDLAVIFVKYLNLKSTFPWESYASSIIDIITNLNKKFWKEISEAFPDTVKQKAEIQINENPYFFAADCDINFCFKIVCFLFQIYKKVLERQILLNNQIMVGLVSSKNRTQISFNDSNANGQNKDLRNINGLYLTINSVIDFIIDNILDTLSKIKPESLNLASFKHFQTITESHLKWLNLENFSHLINAIKSLLVNPPNELIQKYCEPNLPFEQKFLRISLYKSEREKSFLAAFFKKTVNSLRTSMEDETWTPCDIPYIFVHFLAFLCDFDLKSPEKEGLGLTKSQRMSNYLNETNNFEEELKSGVEYNDSNNASPFSLRKDIDFSREAQELKNKTGNNSIRIMKNELFIDENRFMLGTSTLHLIKSLYDFIQYVHLSQENSKETVQKIFELIKCYNSYTCQLILGAGAVNLQKLKAISVKILAFSSFLLSFVGFLFEKISAKIERIVSINMKSETSKLNNDIKNYLQEINLKIITILNERLLGNCESLSKLEWHNKNEKINIPTKFSAQIIMNTKQIYVNIEEYYTKENLRSVFSAVLDDILKYYVVTFESMKIENKTAAQRIKEELEYFLQRLNEMPVMQTLEEKRSLVEARFEGIIRNHCNVFLEMTSIN